MKDLFFSNLPFNQFSEKEQNMILSEMSEEEYEQHRKMLHIAQRVKQNENGLFPSEKSKKGLLNTFENEATVVSIWRSKIAVAAIVLLSFLAYHLMNNSDNQQVMSNNTLSVDTKGFKKAPNEVVQKDVIKIKEKKLVKKNKIIKIDPMLASESDIALTFKRENQNMVWQSEEEDEIKKTETLIPCSE